MNYKRENTPYTNMFRDKGRRRQGREGFRMCLGLLLNNPRTHYVICTYGIGDAILACGLVGAYKKAYNIPHVTLVGKERMRYLYEQYSDQYDCLLLKKEDDIVRMTNAFLFDPGSYLFMRWMKRIMPIPIMFYYRNLLLNHIPAINMVNTFKAVIFGLPQNTPLAVAKPRYVPVDEYIEKYKLVRGKAVILSPAARNTPLMPDSFWERLAVKLYKNGYSVIVNHFDYEKDLPHAINLDCDLSIMLALAEYGGHVISLRSGFCDYMSLTHCKLTVIYPEGWDFVHNVSMADWGIRNDIMEVQFSQAESENILEDIMRAHTGDNPRPAAPNTVAAAGAAPDFEKVRVLSDIGRAISGCLGNIKIGAMLRANKATHYLILGNSEERVRLALALAARFKCAHDIAHLTVVVSSRYAALTDEYSSSYDARLEVSGGALRHILNAFRFDYAYFHYYEWERRVTVASAEEFFRIRYLGFEPLVSQKDIFEIALMPVRR